MRYIDRRYLRCVDLPGVPDGFVHNRFVHLTERGLFGTSLDGSSIPSAERKANSPKAVDVERRVWGGWVRLVERERAGELEVPRQDCREVLLDRE